MIEENVQEMVLNMGPQHPSTHGVIRFIVHTDGEVLRKVLPDIGYLHRGMEKIAEKMTYKRYMPFTDRIDYLAAMNCNQAYAMTVAKLGGITIPPRAEYLRVIASELCRISSHLIMVGSTGLDLGAATPFVHAIREREKVNDLLEMLCGARLTFNYARIGGVSQDLPEGFKRKALDFLNRFEKVVEEYNGLLSYNEIFVKRLAGVAPISREDAISYGLVGPNLRASGVKRDIRKDDGYSIYPELDFEIPVGTNEIGEVGDCFNRYMVRVQEMLQSTRIVKQALEKIPEGEIRKKLPRALKLPKGEVYVRIESARGELGFYLVSDGEKSPYRLKIRTGSFAAMSIIEKVSPGLMLADLVALIATLDVIAPEIDR
jgi:NADH-quinone oxidoreductase subunit D